MGPTSLVVTACIAAENNGESANAFKVVQKVIQERGEVLILCYNLSHQ